MVEPGGKFGIAGSTESKVPFENIFFEGSGMVERGSVGGELAGFRKDSFDRRGFLVVRSWGGHCAQKKW